MRDDSVAPHPVRWQPAPVARARRGGESVAVDLLFVARPGRRSPFEREDDFFWGALCEAGLTRGVRGPAQKSALAADGIALATLEIPRMPRGELDVDAALERSRETLATRVSELERAIARQQPRIVAFLGMSLYAAAVGGRVDPTDLEDQESEGATDRSAQTFRARARFAEAIAVALPVPSRFTPESLVLSRYRDLAALRVELTEKAT
ncbi:MAG: hypothetical protein JNJ88_02025 [Planctomycetes bacterium]|nr:hypothetical protein [Planctomycetota bacterium]